MYIILDIGIIDNSLSEKTLPAAQLQDPACRPNHRAVCKMLLVYRVLNEV